MFQQMNERLYESQEYEEMPALCAGDTGSEREEGWRRGNSTNNLDKEDVVNKCVQIANS